MNDYYAALARQTLVKAGHPFEQCFVQDNCLHIRLNSTANNDSVTQLFKTDNGLAVPPQTTVLKPGSLKIESTSNIKGVRGNLRKK